MKNKIFSFGLAVLFSSLISFSAAFNFNEASNEGSIDKAKATAYDCPQGYTYVRVFENGAWWIYVYCGDVLVHKHVDED